ncbi:MAG: PDZ domain-containing protein [Ignavibacteriales bacterium]|nr:PDZ domain-containing protein [Ignavibacteriales bacterium]
MNKQIKFAVLIVVVLFSALSVISAQHKFYVNMNDRADDLFKVTLIPEKLTEQNKIYQFAATAPGAYQIMDIGRFVRSFKSYDKDDNELAAKQISTNQWELSDPAKTKKIIYTIAETFDTKVDKNPVYAMCGSSLENDHALINGQTVFGYFHGMQKYPVKIKLEYPDEWTVGTALTQDANGYYNAPDYDYVVDSPILAGSLTKASAKVNQTTVDIFTYSKTGLIKSDNILMTMEDMLSSAGQFTKKLPVDRYVFLYHFENFSAGAWEHNYSSIYVYKEDTLSERYASEIRSTAAHEFFHVITPLQIHSGLVENFNYEKPVMSQHLWFYEGVTEWASDIMQLHDYLISLEDYLRETKQKLNINDNFDKKLSLAELGVRCVELQDQYFNIYNKGAVVAALLDIKLLELSKGTRGLRELILELAKKYGPHKAFDEEKFFDEIVSMTYPEIRGFINNYIAGTEPLPVKEYFGKLGIDYTEITGVDSSRIALGFGIGFKDNKFVITNVEPQNSGILSTGDFIYKFDGEEVTLQNVKKTFASLTKMKVGDLIRLTILHGGSEKEVELKAAPRILRHDFKINENPTNDQLALREAWTKNLP